MKYKKQLYRFDPILYLLQNTIGLTPLQIVGLLYALSCILFGLAYWEGVLFDVQYPLVNSYHTIVGSIVLPLSTWGVLRHYTYLPHLLGKLERTKVIEYKEPIQRNPYQIFIQQVSSNRKWLVSIFLALAVLGALQYSWMADGKLGWTESRADQAMSWTGIYFLGYFLIYVIVFLNFVINTSLLQRLFVRINTERDLGSIVFRFKRICPDGLAGVSPISRIIKHILTPLIFTGLFSSSIVPSISQHVKIGDDGSVSSFSWVYMEFGLAIFYIVVLVALVLFLLIPIHRMLKSEKHKLIQGLERWDSLNLEMSASVFESGALSGGYFNRIDKVDKFHKQLSKLPVWPFNVSIAARLIPAALTPFTSVFIELIKKLISF